MGVLSKKLASTSGNFLCLKATVAVIAFWALSFENFGLCVLLLYNICPDVSVLVSNCFWFDRLIPCIFSYILSSQRAASCGLVYLSWLSIRSFDTSICCGYVTFACVDSLGLEFWTVWFGSTLVRFVPMSALWNWRSSESMRCFRKWAFVCLLFPFG